MNTSEPEVWSIAERMLRIESEVRRWRLCTVVLLCVLGVAFLTGAETPAPDILRAKDFVLVGDDGTPRAELRIHAHDPELVFFNRDGKTIPLALSAHPAIVLSGSRNVATLTVGSDGPEISLADSTGYEATIGRIPKTKKQDGTETNPSVVSIAISDAGGKILWSAP